MRNRTSRDLRGRVSDLSPTNLVLLLFAAFLTGMCCSSFIDVMFFDSPLCSLFDTLLLSKFIELVLALVLLYCTSRREKRVLESSEDGQKELRIGNYSPTSFFLLLNAALLSANVLIYLLDYLIRPLYELLPQEPSKLRFQSMHLLGLAINLALLLLGLLLAFCVLKRTQGQASTKDTPSDKENES